MRRSAGTGLLILLLLVTAACTESGTESTPSAAPEPVELKLMEFNIEYGGHEVDFDSVIETIQESDADVVAIEEGWGNVDLIANRLGWEYFDVRTQMLSQYPLLAPPESDGLFTYVELEPGKVVAVGNVHLPSAPYGPNKIRDGADADEILALEKRVRLPAVMPYVDALVDLADDGIPVFLTGDFNAPSHHDWIDATVGLREHVKYPLEWPVSVAVEDAGFRDSYRAIYPDPVESPGITWPAKRPFVKGYNPARTGAAADRIDFVYSAGPATATESVIVGERSAPEVEIAVSPWPTDHRGLLSTFEVTPAAPPTFIAVDQRLVEVGDEVRVTYRSSEGTDGIEVVSEQGDSIADQSAGGSSGTATFSTQGWTAGEYEAVLVNGGEQLSRIPFWLRAPGARPIISTDGSVYQTGEPIEISWENAPGNRWDWAGVYKQGADPNVAYYITWFYTESSIEGTEVMDEGAEGKWPLPAGRYSVYLLEDDGYKLLAGADFTVR